MSNLNKDQFRQEVNVHLDKLKSQYESMLQQARFYQDEYHIESFARQVKHIHDGLEKVINEHIK